MDIVDSFSIHKLEIQRISSKRLFLVENSFSESDKKKRYYLRKNNFIF